MPDHRPAASTLPDRIKRHNYKEKLATNRFLEAIYPKPERGGFRINFVSGVYEVAYKFAKTVDTCREAWRLVCRTQKRGLEHAFGVRKQQERSLVDMQTGAKGRRNSRLQSSKRAAA